MVNKHKNGDRQKGGGEEGAAEARVVRRVEDGGGHGNTSGGHSLNGHPPRNHV